MPGQQHGTRVMFITAHANFYFAEKKYKPLIYLTISQNCSVVPIKTSAINKKMLDLSYSSYHENIFRQYL